MADDYAYSTITFHTKTKKPPQEKESPPQSASGTRYVNTTPHQNNEGMKPSHQSVLNYVEVELTERKEDVEMSITANVIDPHSLNAAAIDNPVYFESATPATKNVQDHGRVEYASVRCLGIEKEGYSSAVTPIRLETQTDNFEENSEACPYLIPVSHNGCVHFSHDSAQKDEDLDNGTETLLTTPDWKNEETKPSVVAYDEQNLNNRPGVNEGVVLSTPPSGVSLIYHF